MVNPTSLTLDGAAKRGRGRSAVGRGAHPLLGSSGARLCGNRPPAPPVHGHPIGSSQLHGRTPDHALKVAIHPQLGRDGLWNETLEIGRIESASDATEAAEAVPPATQLTEGKRLVPSWRLTL